MKDLQNLFWAMLPVLVALIVFNTVWPKLKIELQKLTG